MPRNRVYAGRLNKGMEYAQKCRSRLRPLPDDQPLALLCRVPGRTSCKQACTSFFCHKERHARPLQLPDHGSIALQGIALQTVQMFVALAFDFARSRHKVFGKRRQRPGIAEDPVNAALLSAVDHKNVHQVIGTRQNHPAHSDTVVTCQLRPR